MSDPTQVLDDLDDESRQLDLIVSQLTEHQWVLATPAPRWTIAHQIAHLVWTDRAALLAVTEPDAFAVELEKAVAAPDTFVDDGAEEGAKAAPGELLDRWRLGRGALQAALRGAAPGARFPWFGPAMSAASLATGRLMETWAHGQDVADALGVTRAPTERLRHIARIGVRARDFAFGVRGLAAPEEEFRVELVPPGVSSGSNGVGSGALWAYGPESAPQRVTGPALDFCLLVTRRAHRSDLALHAQGPDADRWLDIAQAFAGPAGTGRPPKGTAAGAPEQVAE
ncbi:Conserved hypothetical protein CHP03084 [Actinobacteria bacterium OK074]|nr:Conserved hypothetical protein CHP03084 [Actinobacteria bacterium OK074]